MKTKNLLEKEYVQLIDQEHYRINHPWIRSQYHLIPIENFDKLHQEFLTHKGKVKWQLVMNTYEI